MHLRKDTLVGASVVAAGNRVALSHQPHALSS